MDLVGSLRPAAPSVARDARPAVSVLVPTRPGGPAFTACLDSLAGQTLPSHEYEVVVVLEAADLEAADVVSRVRGIHQELRLRVIESSERDIGEARNLALAAARGEYVTFVDPRDTVLPTYLDVMVSGAAADGILLGAEATTFSDSVAKMIDASLARTVAYDATLGEGQDPVYWLELLAHHRLRLRVLPDEEQATYRRSTRLEGGDKKAGYADDVTERLRCIGRLDALRLSAPHVDDIGRGLVAQQAQGIARHLRQHPEDHARLVADVVAVGPHDFPWSQVNEGLARDLAICYCFPPFQDTSGMVAAKRLRARGLVTDVVSQDLSAIRPRDPGSVRLVEQVVGRWQVTGGRASLSEWTAVADFAQRAWDTVQGWEEAQGPYRSVYSRAVAMTSHFAAALVKLRRPGIEWVAEFSDPLKIGATGDVRPGEVLEDWLSREIHAGMVDAGFDAGVGTGLFDWVERVAYALADRLVFTNANQMELMLGYCEDERLAARARSIAVVEQHPIPPPEAYELARADVAHDPGVLQLAYFGVFYLTRDLGVVVQALARLRQHERARIRLHVFTNDPDSLSLEVVRAGLAGVVRAHAFVPVLEFLSLTRQFDVLVVNDAATAAHHDVNPYLPSKLADYRASGTPIWAIYEPGSVLSTKEVSHRTALGDVEEAVAVLRALLTEHTPRSAVSSQQSLKHC